MKRALVFALLGLLGAPAWAQEGQVFLHELELESSLSRLDLDAPVELTLELQEGHSTPDELTRRLKAGAEGEGRVKIPTLRYLGSKEKPGPQHRSASFLIDFDQPAVKKLREEAARALGAKPTVSDLERFVGEYIAKKNLSRGYDVASVVAARREGDCSEHAVLLAALSRAFGLPARVVHGLVIAEQGGKLGAFGHAWVEVHQQKAWRVADAALVGPMKRAYVPLVVVREEGPGFALSAAAGMIDVRRIVLAPASAK